MPIKVRDGSDARVFTPTRIGSASSPLKIDSIRTVGEISTLYSGYSFQIRIYAPIKMLWIQIRLPGNGRPFLVTLPFILHATARMKHLVKRKYSGAIRSVHHPAHAHSQHSWTSSEMHMQDRWPPQFKMSVQPSPRYIAIGTCCSLTTFLKSPGLDAAAS